MYDLYYTMRRSACGFILLNSDGFVVFLWDFRPLCMAYTWGGVVTSDNFQFFFVDEETKQISRYI